MEQERGRVWLDVDRTPLAASGNRLGGRIGEDGSGRPVRKDSDLGVGG